VKMTEESPQKPLFERVNRFFNQMTMILLFLMMLLVVMDVFGRYLFSMPFPGTLELTEVFMVYVVFFSLAYTEILGMHVRAQTLVMRFSDRVIIIFDLVAFALGLVFFSFMTWASAGSAWESFLAGQSTETIEFPVYPAKFTISLGCALTVLVFLNKIIRSSRQLTVKNSP